MQSTKEPTPETHADVHHSLRSAGARMQCDTKRKELSQEGKGENESYSRNTEHKGADGATTATVDVRGASPSQSADSSAHVRAIGRRLRHTRRT